MTSEGPGAAGGDLLGEVDALMAAADTAAAAYAGDDGRRQPVHTLYVPADRAAADVCRVAGDHALSLLAAHATGAESFAAATGLRPDDAVDVLPRVTAKLRDQPVEDLRLDFEDGYGRRPDAVEDAHALAAGRALAALAGRADAPLICGVRVKGLQAPTRARGLRTLDLVLRGLAEGSDGPDGATPPRFVVTWPKVSHPAEVTAAVRVSEHLEEAYGLPGGRLRFELQVEVPQAVVGTDGTATVARLVHASAGRCEGLHYGTYDFSAAAGVSGGEQSLEHPLADHAKAVMQLAAAGTGVRVSDGSTNVLPHGPPAAVTEAWRLHARLVLRSLRHGLYQGWDLHPGHLVTRYAATYQFLRAELFGVAGGRLRGYVTRTGGGVLDEPATAQAMAAQVVRGLDCGAFTSAEAEAATGLDRPALVQLVRRTA